MGSGNSSEFEKQLIIKDLDTLNSIKIDIEFMINNIKKLIPYNSGREKSIVITKLEEANHRVKEVIELQKQL